MHNRHKGIVHTLAILFTMAGPMTAAQAANCGLTGKWHMNGMLAYSGGGSVIDCTITLAATGRYTGECGSWTLGQTATHGAASGVIKADTQCALSGVLKAPGFADTTIRGGIVNGSSAALIGSRGGVRPTQVRMITLMKIVPLE